VNFGVLLDKMHHPCPTRIRCGLLICLLTVLAFRQPLNAQSPNAQPITDATPTERRTIQALFDRLDQALVARDPAALQFFGIAAVSPRFVTIEPQTHLSHIAVSPAGALVRQTYRVAGRADDGATQTLAQGAHDFGLARLPDGGFAFTAQRWADPPDALAALSAAAREEWDATQNRVVSGPTALASLEAAPGEDDARPLLLHLVAERRGGRWIALRRARWEGRILDETALRAAEERNDANDFESTLATSAAAMPAATTPDATAWLRGEMARLPQDAAGQAHFFLQHGQSGWVGLGAVWNPAEAQEENETIVARWREQMAGNSYLSAAAHRDFGFQLRAVGLFAEASDQLEMADYLQPGLVSEAQLRHARTQRAYDPAAQAVVQLQKEARIGLDVEHPAYLIETLSREYQTQPTPLRALRIGIEYSKLARSQQAASWLARAERMMQSGALANAPANDVAWANVLDGHLRERQRLLSWKPSNIIRSALFTVRCYPDDRSVLTLLAALESAQHTVYADFGIPMGNTEVVFWRSQSEFQRYTVQFSATASSELVAAMTLTKLLTTRSGPLVLSEEINAFLDPRADFFGTIAHEYGHVAVRHLSRGRQVPVWFNEGIAASVEGGYEGYLPRVREAARQRRLLTMPEMMRWNVDGERAFLAYSQANSMIDYIVARWGKEAVLEILRQIGRDTPPHQAFTQVLGVSQQGLWNAWRQEGIR